MSKFSGRRNVLVYSANGRWRCACGRAFTKSKMCLKCGDKLPRWIASGKITMDQRNRMSDEEYIEWMDNLNITEAVKDISNWFGGT